MLSHIRLETYMRRAAMLGRETVEVPPFVCLFNSHDPLRFFNYAKPLEPVGAKSNGLSESLVTLREAFRHVIACRASSSSRSCTELGPALAAAGFSLEDRYPLLVCTPETLRQMPPIDGLTITTLTPDSPTEDLLACLAVQQQGFGGIRGNPPTLDDVDDLRANLASEGAFLARMAGVPAGTIVCTRAARWADRTGRGHKHRGVSPPRHRRGDGRGGRGGRVRPRRGDRPPDRSQRTRQRSFPAGRLLVVRDRAGVRGRRMNNAT